MTFSSASSQVSAALGKFTASSSGHVFMIIPNLTVEGGTGPQKVGCEHKDAYENLCNGIDGGPTPGR